MLALLAAAHPGDPDDPASWDGYAELAAHVLATSSQSDDRPANRQLTLDTAGYLRATGDNQACRAITEELLDRWRRTLGPDHLDTLTAASTLTAALFWLGETEPARTLSQHTLDRCRQVLSPDHPTTLNSAAVLTAALIRLGETEPARTLKQDTVERCRRVYGPNHPITRLVAWAAGVGPSLTVGDDPSVGLPKWP